jgi:hypothetical protein
VFKVNRLVRRACWMVALAAVGAAGVWCRADGIKEVEVTCDPPQNGMQVYTVRLRPDKNHECEKIVFDCTLCQTIKWEVFGQAPTNRLIEPAVFTYRRKSVKLVEDLDSFTSFRVPVGRAQLKEIYGETTFSTNAPVSVSQMKITGYMNDEPVWSFKTEARGVHTVGKPADEADKPPAKAEAKP